MRNTNRSDGFNDLSGVPDFQRDMVRRDGIFRRQSFNARSGRCYLPDTTTVALTGYLPKMANDGAWVEFFEVFDKWSTNNFTINGNGKTIKLGSLTAATTLTCNLNLIGVRCVYDRVNGLWRVVYA